MIENDNDNLVEVRKNFLRLLNYLIYTTKMRYTFVRPKGFYGQIVIKKSGWIAHPPLKSVGGAGEKLSLFGTVLHLE